MIPLIMLVSLEHLVIILKQRVGRGYLLLLEVQQIMKIELSAILALDLLPPPRRPHYDMKAVKI